MSPIISSYSLSICTKDLVFLRFHYTSNISLLPFWVSISSNRIGKFMKLLSGWIALLLNGSLFSLFCALLYSVRQKFLVFWLVVAENLAKSLDTSSKTVTNMSFSLNTGGGCEQNFPFFLHFTIFSMVVYWGCKLSLWGFLSIFLYMLTHSS